MVCKCSVDIWNTIEAVNISMDIKVESRKWTMNTEK
jgi:hypothetical protein